MQRPQRATGARPRLRSVSVQDELKQRIDRGELPAGTRLPSEPELAAELQVSRATLREALRAMELEGLLRRRQGSGTFVAEHPRMANSLDVNFGVTDAIRAAGMTAGIADGRHWVEPASAGEAALQELEPGQDVLVIERLRTADAGLINHLSGGTGVFGSSFFVDTKRIDVRAPFVDQRGEVLRHRDAELLRRSDEG